jgi:hypothetical protein
MGTRKCDICSKPATQTASNDVGTVHACDDHARYMAGWLRDMAYEARCESMEAARRSEYEMDYYSGHE